MIGLQTELKLAQLLKNIADGEKEIEVVRQVLAEQPDFEPYTAFKRIDRDGSGYISTWELHNFLRDNDLHVLEKDIHNLYKVFDLNQDGRITYTEFLNIVLPKTSPSLRQLATSRQSYYVARYETLPYEVEWALARVFDKEINYFRKVELLKEDLALRYDFNNHNAFRLIDEDRNGFIDLDAIYLFLKRNQIPVTDGDIQALLNRTDRDGDGTLSYSEFVDAITPLHSLPLASGIRSPVKERSSYRAATPSRHTSRLAQSGIFHSAQKKLTNYDYYEYLSNSNRKSRSLARSMVLGDSRSRYSASPSRLRTSQSPVRNSITKRLQEMELRDLETSKSRYLTPSKRRDYEIYSSPSRRSISPTKRASSPYKERQSPMKLNEEDHLARALKEQIDLDRQLEDQKNQLALKSDFNLLDAFRFFDVDGRGAITKTELKEGFNQFDVFPTNDEAYLVMRKFDKDNDGLIRYADFCDMLTPKQIEYASILNDRIPSYVDRRRLSEIFGADTRYLLRKVLNQIINNEVASEALRQKLERRPLFDVYEAFKALDKNDNGYISMDEFRELLIDHGIYASNSELLNLMRRYDKNQDGKISYSEFVQELTPKSPQKY